MPTSPKRQCSCTHLGGFISYFTDIVHLDSRKHNVVNIIASDPSNGYCSIQDRDQDQDRSVSDTSKTAGGGVCFYAPNAGAVTSSCKICDQESVGLLMRWKYFLVQVFSRLSFILNIAGLPV